MTNILKALEFVLSSLIIGSAVFFGLESGFHHQYSMSTVNPYAFEYSEIVELKQPTPPEVIIPEVRLASFEDEFAVDPIIRNLTEQDKKELRLIAEAEDLIDGTEGMLWVMLTVVNRIRANGGTVHSTIYAENQYYTAGMAKYPTDASEEAINLLMCGYDPSEGAKYFRTRNYHSFGEPVAQVGHHYYSR